MAKYPIAWPLVATKKDVAADTAGSTCEDKSLNSTKEVDRRKAREATWTFSSPSRKRQSWVWLKDSIGSSSRAT